MTDKELKQRLDGFRQVWQRVQKAKPISGGAPLKPRAKPPGPASRYDPRRK